jgi:hypothetical protein
MATSAKTTAKTSTAAAKTKTAAAAAATAKPAASKAAVKTTVAKPAAKTVTKVAVNKTATAGKVTKAPKIAKTPLNVQQRHHYVEVAAYFMAERRGFMTGCESEDWLAAEAEIDRLFHEGKLNA